MPIPKHIKKMEEKRGENLGKNEEKVGKNLEDIPHWKKDLAGKINEEEEKKIVKILKNILDPELGVNIYEMGLIYEIKTGKNIEISMTFTTPFCPFATDILNQIEENIDLFLEKECKINIVFSPKWEINFMTQNARLEGGIY